MISLIDYLVRTKKGFSGDELFAIIFIFIIGITAVVAAYALQQAGTSDNAIFNQYVGYAFNGVLSFNSLAPLFVVGSGIALIAASLFIRTNPVFFIVFMVLQIIMAYVALTFSNAWESVFTNNTMSLVAQRFDMWVVLMAYFPFISIVLSIIFAIAVFAKGEG